VEDVDPEVAEEPADPGARLEVELAPDLDRVAGDAFPRERAEVLPPRVRGVVHLDALAREATDEAGEVRRLVAPVHDEDPHPA
jgi:hypothetical protein